MDGQMMDLKKSYLALCLEAMVLAAILVLLACSSTPTPTPSTVPTPSISSTGPRPGGPGGGAIINSDSEVTVKIQAIRQQSSGYRWELDVLVQNSVDVGTLPNPTKDSVGKVVTVKTDEDLTAFKVNDVVTAKVKYVGDVPRPGITLYIYNLAALAVPQN
jgi:hypothetical protein